MKALKWETVYVMDGGEQRKVGRSNNPSRRKPEVSERKRQISVAYTSRYSAEAGRIERAAHRLLKLAGKHIKGEWFSATVDECIEAIERAERVVAGIDPPIPPDVATSVRLQDEMISEVDDWRALQRPIPSRGEAVAALALLGLEAYAREDRE